MLHPLTQDLSQLKDTEIEEKVNELTKKYFQASRLGNAELLTQLSTFITIYKEEMGQRLRAKTQGTMDGDLDQLINVD
jgi:ribosomal protein L29